MADSAQRSFNEQELDRLLRSVERMAHAAQLLALDNPYLPEFLVTMRESIERARIVLAQLEKGIK